MFRRGATEPPGSGNRIVIVSPSATETTRPLRVLIPVGRVEELIDLESESCCRVEEVPSRPWGAADVPRALRDEEAATRLC